MQIKNWNDLIYLQAIKRGGNYSGAAKLLKVDDTTVSRRLGILQKELATQLIVRRPDGTLQITKSGEAILCHIDSIENAVGRIEQTLESATTKCVGTVRITSVPIVVNRMLAPAVGVLLEQHPRLRITLIPDSKDLSLSYLEADLAVRLARPQSGGSLVKTRSIGSLSYSVYAKKGTASTKVQSLPWVSYDDSWAHLPPAKWTNELLNCDESARSHMQVHDAETAVQATLSGSFLSLLPDAVAANENGLEPVVVESAKHAPSRKLWLLGHADQSKLIRITVVSDWIEKTISDYSSRAS